MASAPTFAISKGVCIPCCAGRRRRPGSSRRESSKRQSPSPEPISFWSLAQNVECRWPKRCDEITDCGCEAGTDARGPGAYIAAVSSGRNTFFVGFSSLPAPHRRPAPHGGPPTIRLSLATDWLTARAKSNASIFSFLALDGTGGPRSGTRSNGRRPASHFLIGPVGDLLRVLARPAPRCSHIGSPG